MAEETCMPWQTPFGSRHPNDSSAVAGVLAFRENGDGNGIDHPSIQRSEILPVDEPRGSIGCALQGTTQYMRGTKPPVSTTKGSSPPPSPTPGQRRNLRWQSLDMEQRQGGVDNQRASTARGGSLTPSRSRSITPLRSRSVSPQGTGRGTGRGRASNGYDLSDRASPSDLPENEAADKILELEKQVEGLKRLNVVLRSELPAEKAELASEVAARMRQAATRGALTKDRDASPSSFSSNRGGRSPSVRSNRQESVSEDFGPHNRKCSSSSPMRTQVTPAGKARARLSPRPEKEMEPVPTKPLPSKSPVSSEMPRGRKVLVDKNAPSEHWMASATSDSRYEIKYDWQNGYPSIEWKRKVPDAIPVRATQDKRPADPQGRPWRRQFANNQKNMHSDPWAFEELKANRADGAQAQDAPRDPDATSRRHGVRYKNEQTWHPDESQTAGMSSREASPQPFSRTTRKQFNDSAKNQPSDIFFSPMGADSPGAPYWSSRTPRSTSPPPNAWRNTNRYKPMPGDRGMSPITGKPRAYGRPDSPMRKAMAA